VTLAVVERDVVILACAISAGVHAALAPDHFHEGTGAGLGFGGAAVTLAGLAAVLTRAPANATALAGAIVVLAGLLAAYAVAVTSGLPPLHPDAEAVEGLPLVTKAIEALGLVLAADVLRHRKER
jgi:hypothetical protein